MNAGKFVKDKFESLAASSVIRTLRVFPSNLGTMNADGSFSGGQPDIDGAALEVASISWTVGPGTLTNSTVLVLDQLHIYLPEDTDASIGSLAVTGNLLLGYSTIMGVWNVTDPIIIPAGDTWEFAVGELSFSIF